MIAATPRRKAARAYRSTYLAFCAAVMVAIVLAFIIRPPLNAEGTSDHIGSDSSPFQGDGEHARPTVGGEANGSYTYTGFIWHLERAYAPMSESMAQDAYRVWWCESRMDDSAVGQAGERGVPQLSPIHAPAMAKGGLDFEDGLDRVRYAIHLWQQQGWAPWSCAGER